MNSTFLFSNTDDSNNLIMGMIESTGNTMNNYQIFVSGLTTEEVVVFNRFINNSGFYSAIYLKNTPIYFDCNIMINNNLVLDYRTIDYLELDNEDKEIIDDFINLLKTLKNN